ncbi:MAG TPA: patatin-like phospholipase family protein [Kofleriaceae bacterium]|nr:patatin-like phospholipase family protein [Kofleriaceae bacterium]
MTEYARTPGLVLAGAAALGAYEVGVLAYCVEDVAGAIGAPVPPIASGTSAGALNAMALAAFAEAPALGIRALVRAWTELRLGRILRPSSIELLSMFLDVGGAPLRLRRALAACTIRGALLDQAPIAELVARIPLPRVADHLASGRLLGVAVSATRVATGEAVIFHHASSLARPWRAEPNLIPVATHITANHVLASAAIPLLFPTVEIGGDRYCDGGLRQMVPLSPAIHLGAERLLVVNPLPAVSPAPAVPTDGVLSPVTSPLYLAGKALNALFADRVDADLARLSRTTQLLRAGERRFGPSFEREINLELARAGEPPMTAIDAVCIEPSIDLGALAAEHVTSRSFASRVPGIAERFLRCVVDGDPIRVRDLLAYVLFDGPFMSKLIELGRDDARAHHEELCGVLAPEPGARAAHSRT